MRPIATRTLMGLAALVLLSRPALADDPKGDLAKLQGSWTAKVGPEKDIPITLTVKGNAIEMLVVRPGEEELKLKAEIKLDEKAEPKTFDWLKFTGPDGQEVPDSLSIYKLDGDKWTICSGGPGNDRPAKFEAGEGGPPMLNTFTRVKEKAETTDLEKFQGTWLAKAGPNDEVSISMTIKENAYTATWDQGDGTKVELKGELRLDGKATPRTIDFFKTKRGDGEDAKDSLGIYEFEGDKIKVCVGNGGEERPTEFKKGAETGPHLLTFARKKD